MNQTFTRILLTLTVVAALLPGASALTQTVNPGDNSATIQTAINSVLASADPTGEVVFNAGTYLLDASLTITIAPGDGVITLRGASSANRPVIVCPNYVGGTADDGAFSLAGTGATITVQDLIFLPPAIAGGGPTNPNTIGIGGRASLASCTLNFINLLLTGNNGSNAPTSLDGLRNPALDVGVASRFENACINLIPAAGNASTIIVGATNVICSQASAEGFYMDGSNATTGGCLKAHFYDCVFTWNIADGFRLVRIGQDDRWYRCKFNWNGDGTGANQGIHNSGWNPGTVLDGNGGRSYFENCEASFNRDRGYYIGASENTVVRDCTAIDNGNFFATGSNTAWGFEWVTGQGYWECNGLFASGNRGGTLSVSIAVNALTTVILRDIISLSNGVNNDSAVTDAFTGKSAIRIGGLVNLVEDVYVDNCPALGIWIDANGTQANMDVQIRRCLVRNCGQSGILVWRAGVNSTVVLENLQLENTSYNPLASTNSVNRGNALLVRAPGLSDGATFTIDNVIVDGAAIGALSSQGNGIRVEAAANSTGRLSVSNVDIRNCSNNGLSLAGGVVSVTNAKITNVLNCGIEVAAANPVTMSTVEVVGVVNHGITLGQETEGIPSTPLLIGGLDYLSLVDCATSGVRVFSNQITAPTWTLDHSTIFNCGVGFKMQAANFQSQPVDIQNTIIAGAGKTGVQVVTALTNLITVHNSGLVQQGAYALGTPVDDAANNPSIVVLGANVVTGDPVFAGTTPGLSDFLDVRSTAYGGMGTGGTNLSGRWDYIGDVVGIENWRRY